MTPIVKVIALGLMTITSYRATPAQTKPECLDNDRCWTANGEHVSQLGIAVSQDLLADGEVRYGDIIYVPGFGSRIVNDCMSKRLHRSFDLFVYTAQAEHKVGVRHLHVYKIEVRNE
jgi:3D (Asp-Asp-Asp) domain-containing protein